MIDTQNPDAPRYPVFAKSQDEVPFGVTPSQTVGPYVHIGLFPRGRTAARPSPRMRRDESTCPSTSSTGPDSPSATR